MRKQHIFTRGLGLWIVLAFLLSVVPPVVAAPEVAPLAAISLTGDPYTENFDTLASSGTSSTVPNGWAFSESGTNANTTYTAGTGSSTTGDTYSFGASSSAERAFGGLQSGTLVPTIGAEFQNNTGATIIGLTVSYVCEQWRIGVVTRGAADRMDFQYSTDATSLTTGTWNDVDTLDCLSTVTSDAASGAKDGNSSTYRTAVSGSVTSLSIANGITFWLRWTDYNIASSDDSLAVDDFSLTPTTQAGDVAPSVDSTTPGADATNVAIDSNIDIEFSENVDVTGEWFAISCTSSGSHTATVSGGPKIWTLSPAADFVNSETCTVSIENTLVTDQDTDDPPDEMAADYSWSFGTIAPIASRVLINELDSDTPGTDALEFIELYDGGFGNTPLDGFVVVFYNGSNDLSYAAYDLDGYSTDAGGYFILGNAGVSGVDLVFAGNVLQNGADAAAVYQANAADFPTNTAVTLVNLVDAVVYDTADADDVGLLPLLNAGQPQVNESGKGSSDVYSIQRCPNGSGGQRNTDTYEPFLPTPGVANLCPDYIHDIQGSGDTATAGTFTVEAIVVGDFQGATGVDDYKLDGFFIQEENADIDASAATSEGIFVYCGACPKDVVVGDKVQVTGASSEYFGMSQLNATTADAVVVVSSGNALPSPAALTLPVPGVSATDLAGAQAQINAYYEPFEGMLVQIGEQLSVTEYFELYRYGQVVLAQGGRFRQFTDLSAPLAAGYTAHQIDLARRKVILDDDSNQQNHALMENPDIPVFHPVPGFSITNYFRGGDTITNLTGVLHWSFAGQTGTDAWRIRPVTGAFSYAFTSGNPRTAAPATTGNIRVASFNVLNYFTTLVSRGADSTAELNRQADKIVAAINGLAADVIGVMEIENNGTAIADLVSRLNAAAGAGTYAYINTGVVGTDEITVGIIYKPARVTPVGTVQTLTSAAFTDPNSTGSQRSRPAVAQTFEEVTWGERFTVVVNHLKSKGCDEATGLDLDQGDGQGCWNDTRQQGAAYLVGAWIPALAASIGDPDFLIVGDLNSYRLEDPITNITGAGYTDLLNRDLGAAAYGYVFDGQLGYLDHALSSAPLSPQVTSVAHWHINADEVNLLDYNDTVKDATEADFEVKPAATALYESNAYRSSDHDPVLAGLGLYPDQGDLASSYGSAWHTGQGVLRLGAAWTGEASSTPDGDNASDDGVAFTSDTDWGDGTAAVDVTVTGGNGCLSVWMDKGDDGVFDAGDLVINQAQVSAGPQTVTVDLGGFTFPATSSAYKLRFRLTPRDADGGCDGDAYPTGLAATSRANGGEVEDRLTSFGPNAVGLAAFGATAGAASPVGLAGLLLAGLAGIGLRRRSGKREVWNVKREPEKG